jgi:uncharacterized protein (TIGR03067 family)
MYVAWTLLALGMSGGQVVSDEDLKTVQGTWKISAIVENNKTLGEKEISSYLSADGRVTFDGNTFSLLVPGSFSPRKLIFTLGKEGSTNTIDFAGGTRGGGKGIYMASGDNLLLCISIGPDAKRPTEFATSNEDQMLVALKRLPKEVFKKDPPLPVPVPPKAVEDKNSDAFIRRSLIGTWGHQDDENINYYTLNDDGTFSHTQTWKKAFARAFHEEVRSSGNWKLDKGVIIATTSASTDASRRGQVNSFRVTTVGKETLQVIDNTGRSRMEWRVVR